MQPLLRPIRLGAAGSCLLAVLVLGSGCSRCSEPDDPVEQVRAVMARVQEAASRGEVKTLKELVSPGYADKDGRDKQALGQLLTFHYLRNRSHHVFSLVRSVEELGDGDVAVVALAALAGQPVRSADRLSSIRADMFRFDFRWRKEDGDWLCVRSAWQRAAADDFL